MFLSPASITRKVTLMCLFFGLVPLLVSGSICFRMMQQIDEAATAVLETTAVNIADKIDRNLFERYGDVQAFTLNQVIDDRDSWYVRDPQKNKIAQLMDQYVDGYDVYAYSLLVDLEGKPIAASSRDHEGKPIDTAFIYDQNYKDEDWFLACQKGEFHTSTKFSAEKNRSATGTFVEDVHFDEDCAKIIPQDKGLTLAFAAPVYRDGKTIAYWNNHVRFSLVEDIVKAEFQALKAQGLGSAEITIINGEGQIVLDFDPVRTGKEECDHDFEKVIFKLNLVEKGVPAAQQVALGHRGNNYSLHARKQINQGCGYAPLVGAMGYPGLPWGVIVRVPEADICAQGTATARRAMLVTAVVAAFIIGVLGLFAGRRFSRPICEVSQAAEQIAAGNLNCVLTHQSNDEVGRLADVFRSMTSTLQGLNSEAQRLVQSAQAGDLQQRVNADQFSGCYRELIRGMNAAVEAFAVPTEESLKVLTQVADGDLRVRMTGEYQGEFERLAVCVNAAVTNLDDMIAEVATVGHRLGDAVQQTKSNSQSVAESATEQASTLAETASSLEEISSMVKQTADNSHQAKVLSQEAQSAIDEGHGAMTRLTEAIQKIKSSADEQARIVKTIDEIAFQTNLLALNAAVEAARAGDAGRGFAVVADEVRRLAQRSAEAARTTANMIEGSVTNVEHGVQIAQQVSEMLNEIKFSGHKTTELVTEIAAATHEQSLGIGQINCAVSELDKSTQIVANSASNVASVTQDLSHQSASLADLISRFSISAAQSTKVIPNTTVEPTVGTRATSTRVSPTSARALERLTSALPKASATNRLKEKELVAVSAEELIPFDTNNRDFGDF